MVPRLSIVIITRNEEAYIARCLEAALASTVDIEACDVVLVDSCSTDRTVEIAGAFPVRIIRLSDVYRVCPAMGRYVGARVTSGLYVLFLDGDTTVDPRWVQEGIRVLDVRPQVAGVAGREDQIYYSDRAVVGGRPDYFQTGTVDTLVCQFGGNAMYRRVAVNEVGSFNPFVRSYEEAELGARLRRAGWALVRTQSLMACHHTPRPDGVTEYWRRIHTHLLTGQGQVLRLSLGQAVFWEHVRALNRVLLYIGWLVLGIATVIVGAAIESTAPFAGWSAATVGLVFVFIYRSRSATKPLRMIFDWSVCSLPLIWGFLLRPLRESDFSLAAAILSDTDAIRQPNRSALRPAGKRQRSTSSSSISSVG